MKVENKTIVVTGGGNGMGRELVLALLEKGARVMDWLYRLNPRYAAGLIHRKMKSRLEN